MKNFTKISSVLIVAAVAAVFSPASRADDITVKPLRYQPFQSPPLFTAKEVATPNVTCAACAETFKPVTTQDSKLKTKTILVASHACKECTTTILRTGAQKATGKNVTQHKCGALVASVENCRDGMK